MAVAIIGASAVFGAPAASATETNDVPRTVIQPSAIGVPPILSADDAMRYAQIFELQEGGHWKAADRIIKRLQDRLLLGHVLYQRYMHPTKYRSKYAELKEWLATYGDHPDTKRIYRLALNRRADGEKAPRRPLRPRSAHSYADVPMEMAGPRYRSTAKRSQAQAKLVDQLRARVTRYQRLGHPQKAELLLAGPTAREILDDVEFDIMRADIASAYFFEGNDKKAFELAAASAKRSRKFAPMADWTAGLAAWRAGRIETAQRHFEALARSETASRWHVSAGAVWASRTYLRGRKPARVNEMLKLAAKNPRTFYGLIAGRLLGTETGISTSPPPLQRSDLERLLQIPGGKRAIALTQAGRYHLADRELRTIYLTADSSLGKALLGLAHRLELPAMQFRLARGLRDTDGVPYDAALYPLPPWLPSEGFTLDRALVFAFMRQESQFNVSAKSHRGARGLMQLMPRTASYVANDKSLRGRDKSKLFTPEFNIDLGQKYLAYLMDSSAVRGNLFLLPVAYNGGPGNLQKWLKRVDYQDDPLLFIESVPSFETRTFVQRVVSNFWIYRILLNQDTPSLDAVATGHWPYYLSLDGLTVATAQNARF